MLEVNLEAVEPYPATRVRTGYFVRAAWEANAGEMRAAVVPGMRPCACIARVLSSGRAPSNVPADVTVTYSSGEFGALTAELDAMLHADTGVSSRVRAACRYATACELACSDAPNLPVSLLRGLARYAGCHIYCDSGDQILADRSFVVVHTAAGGAARVRLPEAGPVWDVFARRKLGDSVPKLDLELVRPSTTFLYLGDRYLLADDDAGR